MALCIDNIQNLKKYNANKQNNAYYSIFKK